MNTPGQVFSRSQLLTRAFDGAASEEPSTCTCTICVANSAAGGSGLSTAVAIGSGCNDGVGRSRGGAPEGRIVALQTSLALAVMLVLVGAIVSTVYIRSQNAQIAAELEMVAMAADDANDPPPGMALVLRTDDGKISVSEGGRPGMSLLSGPAG